MNRVLETLKRWRKGVAPLPQNGPGIGPDDKTPLGDSPEVHDEISPRDLPLDNPGRQEAERQAARSGGVTRGDLS
jgi:hypothetical protein